MNSENNNLSEEDIRKVLDLYKAYKEKRKTQEMRGLNDFNIFTALLDASDEVRLHSRFLHTLLDPQGSHGQQNLFLDLFLQKVGLCNLDLDIQSCKVYKEYKNIDLYITDGTKHIIIENKIYAGDQERQIERYIDTIKTENKDDKNLSENLLVIYLSLDRSRPNENSLGTFKYKSGILTRGDEKYQLLAITYKDVILNWVRAAREQVANITNLSVGLRQYEEVILKLYGTYEGKLMTLETYLKTHNIDELAVLKDIKQIHSEFPALRDSYIKDIFTKSIRNLHNKLPGGWSIEGDISDNDGCNRLPLKIKPSQDSQVYYALDFERSNYIDAYHGITICNKNVKLDILRNNPEIKSLVDGLKPSFRGTSDWWLGWDWYNKGDFFDLVIDEGGKEQATKKFTDDLQTAFDRYIDIIVKCNEIHDSEKPENDVA